MILYFTMVFASCISIVASYRPVVALRVIVMFVHVGLLFRLYDNVTFLIPLKESVTLTETITDCQGSTSPTRMRDKVSIVGEVLSSLIPVSMLCGN